MNHAVFTYYSTIDRIRDLLVDVEKELFFSPIGNGKWSIAAIVTHLLYWDDYFYSERFSLMLQFDSLPKGNVNEDEVNKKAEAYAHSGISKSDIIEQFIEKRKTIVEELNKINVLKEFSIGENAYSIEKYIYFLADHDQHHIKQMETFIKSNHG